jgi:hypothetical protein
MFYQTARFLRGEGWSAWDVLQLRAGESVVWLIFRPGQGGAEMVGKLNFPGPDRDAALRECAALASLAPVAGQLSVPRLLFQEDSESGFVHLQSAMPGRPLRRELSPFDEKGLGAQFEIIEEWLARFQSIVPARGDLASVLQKLPTPAPPNAIPRALLDAADENRQRLSGAPATPVHGDLFGGNVLVAGGRASVIDWSTFHYGAPLEDLFSFATGAVFQWRDINHSANLFWDLFFSSSPLAKRTREATRKSLARFKAPAGLLRPIFLMYLIDRLTRTQYRDCAAWSIFVQRYIASDMPTPWGGAG